VTYQNEMAPKNVVKEGKKCKVMIGLNK